jgi:predicted nucleic acid-binding protein
VAAFVIDASALTEVLIGSRRGSRLSGRLLRREHRLHAPVHVDLEVQAALRSMLLRGALDESRAEESREDLRALRLRRWPLSDDVLARAWALRENATPYDATYVALAEILGATLVSTDTRLVRAVRSHTGVGVLAG